MWKEKGEKTEKKMITTWSSFIRDHFFGYLLSILLCVGLAVLGVYFYVDRQGVLRRCNYETLATITHVSESADIEDSTRITYSAKFEFKYKGRSYNPKEKYRAVNQKMEVGDHFTLMLNADDPSEFCYPGGIPCKAHNHAYNLYLYGAAFFFAVILFMTLKSISDFKHVRKSMFYEEIQMKEEAERIAKEKERALEKESLEKEDYHPPGE